MSNLRPEFEKYAGKIVNVDEVKSIVKIENAKPGHKLKLALKRPLDFVKSLFSRLHAQPSYESLHFYVTKKAVEEKTLEQVTRPYEAYAEYSDTFFEASNVLNSVYMLAGAHALTESFLKAVDTAPDHSRELESGNLVESGFSITFYRGQDPGPSIVGIPITPALPQKEQSIVRWS